MSDLTRDAVSEVIDALLASTTTPLGSISRGGWGRRPLVCLPASILTCPSGSSVVRRLRCYSTVILTGQINPAKLRHHRRRCHGRTPAQRRRKRGWA